MAWKTSTFQNEVQHKIAIPYKNLGFVTPITFPLIPKGIRASSSFPSASTPPCPQRSLPHRGRDTPPLTVVPD